MSPLSLPPSSRTCRSRVPPPPAAPSRAARREPPRPPPNTVAIARPPNPRPRATEVLGTERGWGRVGKAPPDARRPDRVPPLTELTLTELPPSPPLPAAPSRAARRVAPTELASTERARRPPSPCLLPRAQSEGSRIPPLGLPARPTARWLVYLYWRTTTNVIIMHLFLIQLSRKTRFV